MSRRPFLLSPRYRPAPGPVPYQPQDGLRAAGETSIGLDQVAPSSVLEVTQTCVAGAFPEAQAAKVGYARRRLGDACFRVPEGGRSFQYAARPSCNLRPDAVGAAANSRRYVITAEASMSNGEQRPRI